MKLNTLLVLLLLVTTTAFISTTSSDEEIKKINATLDSWHEAAADADFNTYFEMFSKDAIFIGTDATENWTYQDFKAYAKPHFDKGKAWHFTPLERHVFIDEGEQIAWFDELLSTQMKICRGSGVLKKINGQWKITHYVLSMTVPNENANAVIAIKKSREESIIDSLLKQK